MLISSGSQTMVNRSPSLELVGKAIEAHLSPTVLLQSLPRALELLAHVCLLADKLQQEITRILRDDERKGPKSEYARLSEKSGMRLKTYAAEVEKASRRLWQISVDLRLNVSLMPAMSLLLHGLTILAHCSCLVAWQEGVGQNSVPHRMLLPSTYSQGWPILIEKDIYIL